MKRPVQILTLVLTMVGCGSSAAKPALAPAPAAQAEAASAPAPSKAAAKPADAKPPANESRSPVIIYQGDVRMVADEDAIPKTIDRIIDLAETAGGHLASRKDAMVQIKVPSGSFRDVLTKIDDLGGVVSRSVNADDVSEEFHDLEVRLANLRTTQKRLQEFMARATNVNELLNVERELERISQEIDRIQGRLEFLRTRAAMSTITVALSAKPKIAPVVATRRPQSLELPVEWLESVGIDKLLTLRK
jgi:hypothetical protein